VNIFRVYFSVSAHTVLQPQAFTRRSLRTNLIKLL